MGFSYSTILASKGGKTPVSAATATAGAISPSVAPTTGVIEDEFVNNIAPGGNPPTPAQAPVPTATVTATIPSVEPVTSVIEDEIIVNDIAPESSKIVVSSLRMRATATVVSVMVPRPSAWSSPAAVSKLSKSTQVSAGAIPPMATASHMIPGQRRCSNASASRCCYVYGIWARNRADFLCNARLSRLAIWWFGAVSSPLFPLQVHN